MVPITPETPERRSPQVSRRSGPKRNTCGNSSLQKRLTRQLNGIMAHLEEHPRDTLSQQRVSTIRGLLSQ